jgi:hypothetical protein
MIHKYNSLLHISSRVNSSFSVAPGGDEKDFYNHLLCTDQKFHIKIKFLLKYFCNKSTLQLINLAMVQLTMNITSPYKEINSVFFASSNHCCSFIGCVQYKKRIKGLKKCRGEDDSENQVIKRLRLNSVKH